MALPHRSTSRRSTPPLGPVVFLLACAGCSRVAPPDTQELEPPPRKAEAPPVALPAPAPESATATDPLTRARALAQRWCTTGGEQFGPPGGDPDGYPPPLSSCDDITTSVSEAKRMGPVSASVLTINAGFESRDVLLFQDGATDHTIELHHEYDDESGEAGTYVRWYATTELRDVYGDSRPEWIAVTTMSGGDSFEASRCYAHETTIRTLLVCTLDTGTLRCAAVDTTAYQDVRPRSADQLYDCEEPPPKDDISRSGYAQDVRVEKDALVLTLAAEPVMDELAEPEYEGRVSLDTLLETEPLEP